MTDDNLKDLSDKIAAFKAKDNAGDSPGVSESAKIQGMRAATEIATYPLAGAVLGYGIDYWLGTVPAATLILLFFAFGMGTWRAYSVLNKEDDKEDKKP